MTCGWAPIRIRLSCRSSFMIDPACKTMAMACNMPSDKTMGRPYGSRSPKPVTVSPSFSSVPSWRPPVKAMYGLVPIVWSCPPRRTPVSWPLSLDGPHPKPGWYHPPVRNGSWYHPRPGRLPLGMPGSHANTKHPNDDAARKHRCRDISSGTLERTTRVSHEWQSNKERF